MSGGEGGAESRATHGEGGGTRGTEPAGTQLFDLTGHVAAVVGGGGVLGGALCAGFASAGAKVAVMGRSIEHAEERAASLTSQGFEAVAIGVDATDRGSIEAARRTAEEKLGPVDILVNAPGTNSSTPFFEITLEEWHRILDTNLTSYFIACQVFGKAMVDRGTGGSIINVSSASSEIPLSRVLTYSVSKAGINILTRYLARELAPHRIRVNALVPGFFPAEQNRRLLDEERLEDILRRTPLKRLGEPEELIGTAIWLASDRAAGFVTGALVPVDGGFLATSI